MVCGVGPFALVRPLSEAFQPIQHVELIILLVVSETTLIGCSS